MHKAEVVEPIKVMTDGFEALRARVRQIITAEDLTQKDVSRASGIAYGTLTGWLSGTYAGRSDRIAADVERWLGAREERRAAIAFAPASPGFVRTPTAERCQQALTMAQVLPDIVAIVGAAGIGKTESACAYRESNPNVWMVTANPAASGANTIMTMIAEEMRLVERNSQKLTRAIGQKVLGAQGLIIVDEAQHLGLTALEQLRSIHDAYGVGFAFVGNETVHGLLSGGRHGEHAQLSSRFGYRLAQRRPVAPDIEMLLDAWAVDDDAQRQFLVKVGGKPGALRVMTKVLRLTALLGGGEARSLAGLRFAYERLTRSPDSVGQEDRS